MEEDTVELLRSNLEHAKLFNDKFDHLQNGQDPDYVTVCCSDSRVLQDHMWGNKHPGSIFTVSNIGNRVFQQSDKKFVSGDVLYPVEHTDTRTIIVVGHTSCGAVTASYQDIKEGLAEPEGIEYSIEMLESVISNGVSELPEDVEDDKAVNMLVEYNVDKQVEVLLGSKNIEDNVDIVGVVYDFQDVYNGSRGEAHVINVNGTRDESALKNQHPEIQDRVKRLWSY